MTSETPFTESQYWALLAEQEGMCAICGNDDPGVPDAQGRFHVDDCGDGIRGLLCAGCKAGLGSFRSNVDRILRAANYVDEYRKERYDIPTS